MFRIERTGELPSPWAMKSIESRQIRTSSPACAARAWASHGPRQMSSLGDGGRVVGGDRDRDAAERVVRVADGDDAVGRAFEDGCVASHQTAPSSLGQDPVPGDRRGPPRATVRTVGRRAVGAEAPAHGRVLDQLGEVDDRARTRLAGRARRGGRRSGGAARGRARGRRARRSARIARRTRSCSVTPSRDRLGEGALAQPRVGVVGVDLGQDVAQQSARATRAIAATAATSRLPPSRSVWARRCRIARTRLGCSWMRSGVQAPPSRWTASAASASASGEPSAHAISCSAMAPSSRPWA